MVKRLDRVASSRHRAEGPVKLRQTIELQHDVELRQMLRTESELPARDAIAAQSILGLEVLEVRLGGVAEFGISHSLLEVAPDVIDVQSRLPLCD